MLAPPWIPIPPPGYGGIEAVVHLLTRELVRAGHDVTLFAAPGTRSEAEVVTLLDAPHPEAIERALYEADHVARAFAHIERSALRGKPYDVIHDHCGFTAFAMADRISVPVVHTLHGPFTPATCAFYSHHAGKAHVVAISATQRALGPLDLEIAAVVPNPIDAAGWPLVTHKDPYLLWIGRMTAEKGPQRAIEVARRADMKLILAGPVQPGQESFYEHEVLPHLNGRSVIHVGEVAGQAKIDLFARAHALLMPIRWPEPFGMVMLEAMICGTPVLAFPEGAAVEIVTPGVTGFLVEDEEEMARTVSLLADIDPVRCRETTIERCDARSVAAAYEEVYRAAVGTRQTPLTLAAAN
jgi:glycosyltransferase involved in cell wall biosynthesis